VLETLREYGREQLVEANEVDRFGARHAAHYLELAEAAEPHLKGSDDAEWAARIESELDNLRAALAWTQDADRETSVRLLFALWLYWYQGRAREGWEWMEPVVRASLGSGAPVEPELEVIAALLSVQVGHPETEPLLRRGIERAEAAGTTPRPEVFTQLGLACLEHNDVDDAFLNAERGLAMARERGDAYAIADALCGFATVCSLAGDENRARRHADEALARARALGNSFILSYALLVSGIVRCASEPAAAVEQLGASTAWRRDPHLGIHCLFKGIAHLHLGEFDQAAAELDQAFVLMLVLGNDYYVRMTAQVVPGLLLAVGATEPAVRLLSATDHIRESARLVGTPRELVAQDRIRRRLEGMTDPEEFEAAWAEGQSMSLADAVELARAQLARLSDHAAEEPPLSRGSDAPTADVTVGAYPVKRRM
jgi:tetratricopeptide (TPR) repeat protein